LRRSCSPRAEAWSGHSGPGALHIGSGIRQARLGDKARRSHVVGPPAEVLHTGDIVVFDFSHIGIVADGEGDRIFTIEANTGATGSRDGDGIFRKDRPREVARCFIRLLV
jgi:hypothetical protein